MGRGGQCLSISGAGVRTPLKTWGEEHQGQGSKVGEQCGVGRRVHRAS